MRCDKALLSLCLEIPFDAEKAERYIKENRLSGEDVTRMAIKLCEEIGYARVDFVWEHGREPEENELTQRNSEEIFSVLIENGLDPNLVICDNGTDYENIMQSLTCIQHGNDGVKILRKLLLGGGDPNIVIDVTPFFEEFDMDFTLDAEMNLYPHKWQMDNAFAFWLVLMGFGGKIKNRDCPVSMQNGCKAEIFRDFEKFDYRIKRSKDDFTLEIFFRETGEIAAIL